VSQGRKKAPQKRKKSKKRVKQTKTGLNQAHPVLIAPEQVERGAEATVSANRGRSAATLAAIVDGGLKKFSRTEIEFRQRAEEAIRSNSKAYLMHPEVQEDPVANAKFEELCLLYSNNPYVDRMDSDLMNQYCLMWRDMAKLRKLQTGIEDYAEMASNGLLLVGQDQRPLEPDEFNTFLERANDIGKSIRALRQQMVPIMDRLLLTPTSRIKAVPKTPPKEKPKIADGEDLFT
jgi:hypothetical protein